MINIEYLEKVAAGSLADYIPGMSSRTAKDIEYNLYNAWNNPLLMGGIGAYIGHRTAGALGGGSKSRVLAGAAMVPLAYIAQTDLNKKYNPGYYGKKMTFI